MLYQVYHEHLESNMSLATWCLSGETGCTFWQTRAGHWMTTKDQTASIALALLPGRHQVLRPPLQIFALRFIPGVALSVQPFRSDGHPGQIADPRPEQWQRFRWRRLRRDKLLHLVAQSATQNTVDTVARAMSEATQILVLVVVHDLKLHGQHRQTGDTHLVVPSSTQFQGVYILSN